MYNPYRNLGEWIDCEVCNTSHRKILPADLIEYIDADGRSVKLTDEESTRCYKCVPIKLYYSLHCKHCGHDGILEALYGEKHPSICPQCGYDHSAPIAIKGPMHFEKRPTLKGEAAELFNRIKKRNYGSTMPDY